MDERMEFLDDFDLLMENASHSKRIYGDTDLRSRWGHNCSGREQKQRKRASILGKAFWPSAHWWSLE
jgi:hypothetical protein